MQKSKFIMCTAAAGIALSVSLFSACKKTQPNVTTTPTTEVPGYANDLAVTEQIFEDVQVLELQAYVANTSQQFDTRGCALLTKSGASTIIDYGLANCQTNYGRYRRGKITINSVGDYMDSGSSYTTTFNGYYQDDHKVQGTKTVTNMGRNSMGQPWFSITVDAKVTKPDGRELTVKMERGRTWVEGYGTRLALWDEIYHTTGSGSLSSVAGSIQTEILVAAPLVTTVGCRWIQAGAIMCSSPGSTSTFNYGDTPACESLATLTLTGGSEFRLYLP